MNGLTQQQNERVDGFIEDALDIGFLSTVARHPDNDGKILLYWRAGLYEQTYDADPIAEIENDYSIWPSHNPLELPDGTTAVMYNLEENIDGLVLENRYS